MEKTKPCPNCKGSGKKVNKTQTVVNFLTKPTIVAALAGTLVEEDDCPTCDGTGEVPA